MTNRRDMIPLAIINETNVFYVTVVQSCNSRSWNPTYEFFHMRLTSDTQNILKEVQTLAIQFSEFRLIEEIKPSCHILLSSAMTVAGE